MASVIYSNIFPLSLCSLFLKSVFLHISSCCTCPGPPTGNRTQSMYTTSQTFRDEYITHLKHNVCDDINGAEAVEPFPLVEGAQCLRNVEQAISGTEGRMFAITAVLGFCVCVCEHKPLLCGFNDYIRAGLIGCLHAWQLHQLAEMHPDGLWVILESVQTVCVWPLSLWRQFSTQIQACFLKK